tara:strand:- start:118 stop:303 length:186 start_codon:yes stop_codon:yes gene_type:complete
MNSFERFIGLLIFSFINRYDFLIGIFPVMLRTRKPSFLKVKFLNPIFPLNHVVGFEVHQLH